MQLFKYVQDITLRNQNELLLPCSCHDLYSVPKRHKKFLRWHRIHATLSSVYSASQPVTCSRDLEVCHELPPLVSSFSLVVLRVDLVNGVI